MEFAAERAGLRLNAPARQLGRRSGPVGMAILLHALGVGVLWRAAPMRLEPPASPAVIEMMFVPATAVAQVTIAAISMPAPTSVQSLSSLAAPPAISLAAAAPHRNIAPARMAARLEATAPPAARQQADATEASPRAAPAPVDGTVLTAFETRVSQAVQAAAIYPPAARLLHREGRARIRFDYEDGAVSALAVAERSPFRLLDGAALDAVRRASIPEPPAEIAGRRLTMLVWVKFGLVAED